MTNDFQQFLTAYSAATDDIKALIDSEQIGQFADELVTEPTGGKQKRQIIVLLSNRILDIINDSELVDELEQAGLSADAIAKAKAFVERKPATTPVEISASVQADLEEIEKTLHQISPVRTMASDGKQIGYSSLTEDTYTSTQSAIINESK